MDETSLEDFVDAGADEDHADTEAGERAEERTDDRERSRGDEPPAQEHADTETESDEASGPPVAPAAVQPATTTYRWSPEGVVCTACEATVERLWNADRGLVCGNCKRW